MPAPLTLDAFRFEFERPGELHWGHDLQIQEDGGWKGSHLQPGEWDLVVRAWDRDEPLLRRPFSVHAHECTELADIWLDVKPLSIEVRDAAGRELVGARLELQAGNGAKRTEWFGLDGRFRSATSSPLERLSVSLAGYEGGELQAVEGEVRVRLTPGAWVTITMPCPEPDAAQIYVSLAADWRGRQHLSGVDALDRGRVRAQLPRGRRYALWSRAGPGGGRERLGYFELPEEGEDFELALSD